MANIKRLGGWVGFENQHQFDVKHDSLSMDAAPQWILAVKGLGGLSKSVKKGKFVTKIFFSDNAE